MKRVSLFLAFVSMTAVGCQTHTRLAKHDALEGPSGQSQYASSEIMQTSACDVVDDAACTADSCVGGAAACGPQCGLHGIARNGQAMGGYAQCGPAGCGPAGCGPAGCGPGACGPAGCGLGAQAMGYAGQAMGGYGQCGPAGCGIGNGRLGYGVCGCGRPGCGGRCGAALNGLLGACNNPADYVPRIDPHYYRQTQPAGPPTGTVGYPYYTTRGPRDFFLDQPSTIGY